MLETTLLSGKGYKLPLCRAPVEGSGSSSFFSFCVGGGVGWGGPAHPHQKKRHQMMDATSKEFSTRQIRHQLAGYNICSVKRPSPPAVNHSV